MASPNNTGTISSTRGKKSVIDTSRPKLQTDNVLLISPVGYASAAEENRLHQSSPELREPSPVSPLSAGSLAGWLGPGIWEQTDEGEEEELSLQAQVEKELRHREVTQRLEEPLEWRAQINEEQEEETEPVQQINYNLDPGKSVFRGSVSKNKGCEGDREDLEREVYCNDSDHNLYTWKTIGVQEKGGRGEGKEKEKEKGKKKGRGKGKGKEKGKGKGKGKEKEILPSICERLPREIIQQILCYADPNTFDTLTLISPQWYHASKSAFIYALQLRKLGVLVQEDQKDDKLPELIDRFNSEARRGLFETYLKPKITEVQLICSSPSSAGALPGGDSFRFEFSAKGSYLLALSSSRIFVVFIATGEVSVKREFKIRKRPVTAAILDDGLALAVLSSNHVVTLYDISGESARIVKTLSLDNPPRTIALSPGAAVLAAAYDGGIEVYSLSPSALATDRRAVNCDPVDSLAFSSDGLVLLGTTLHTRTPTTVIISAPFFSTEFSEEESLSQMWTTQVLFPRSSRDNSHATLLPEGYYNDDDENTWAFTFDRHFETFRAVRVDDLRNGYTYFAGPTDEKSAGPTVLPSPSPDGEMVAVGFGGKRVWVYGIPRKLDLEHETTIASDGHSNNSTENILSDAGGNASNSAQQGVLQVLSDRSRNIFVRGRQIGEVEGLTGLKFVKCPHGERLVAVASGGVGISEGGEGEDLIVDGGRVIIFDFGRYTRSCGKTIITIEIGDGQLGKVEALTEEERDLETEVQMARRRTVSQRTRRNRQQAQNQHNIDHPALPSRQFPRSHGSVTGLTVRPSAPTRRPVHLTTSDRSPAEASPVDRLPLPSVSRGPSTSTFSPGDGDISNFEEVVEVPYSQGEPRSSGALRHRAGARPPFGPPRHQQAVNSGGRVVGPNGQPIPPQHPMRDEPWEAPPPPYTPRSENEPPLPQHLLLTLQPRGTPLPILPPGLSYLTGPVTLQQQQELQQRLLIHQQLMSQLLLQQAPQQQPQQPLHLQPPQSYLQHSQQPQSLQQPQRPPQPQQRLQPHQLPQQAQENLQTPLPRSQQHLLQSPQFQPQSQSPQLQLQPRQLQQLQLQTRQPQQPQSQQPQFQQSQQLHQSFPPQQWPQLQSNSHGIMQGPSVMDMMRRGLNTWALPAAIRQQLHLEPPTPIQKQAHRGHFPNHSMLNVSTAIASTSAPSSPAVGNGERGFERSNSAPLSPGGDVDFSFQIRRQSSVSLQSVSSTVHQPPRQYDQDQAQIASVTPVNIPLPGTPPIRPIQRPEISTAGLSPMPSLDPIQQPQHTQQHSEYLSSPPNTVTPDSPSLPTSRNPNHQPQSMSTNPQESQRYQQHTQIQRSGNAPSRMEPSPLRRSTSTANRGTLRILSRSMSRSAPARGRYTAATSASSATLTGDPTMIHDHDHFMAQAHARSSSRSASGVASARGGPPYAIPVGSVRRNPSRPERSAVKNVRDAKQRRLLMQMQELERGSAASSMTKLKDGKGSCVLM